VPPPPPWPPGTPRLWDGLGTPCLPHVPCPTCRQPGEVCSAFDAAWCCRCGWRGSLTAMHAVARLETGEFALTFDESQLAQLAQGGRK
jgi:hypothetical protein